MYIFRCQRMFAVTTCVDLLDRMFFYLYGIHLRTTGSAVAVVDAPSFMDNIEIAEPHREIAPVESPVPEQMPVLKYE